MKKILLVFLLLGLSSTALAYDIHLVYQLKGTAVGEMRKIPDFTGDGSGVAGGRGRGLCGLYPRPGRHVVYTANRFQRHYYYQ